MSDVPFQIPSEPEPMQARLTVGVLPPIGWPVRFYPRPGEGRNRRAVFPALVVAMDETTGIATLLIFFGRDDVVEDEFVPRRSEQNLKGWELLPGFEKLLTDTPDTKKADLVQFTKELAGFDAKEPAQPDALTEIRRSMDEVVAQVWGDEPGLDQPLVKVITDLYARVKVLESAAPKKRAAK